MVRRRSISASANRDGGPIVVSQALRRALDSEAARQFRQRPTLHRFAPILDRAFRALAMADSPTPAVVEKTLASYDRAVERIGRHLRRRRFPFRRFPDPPVGLWRVVATHIFIPKNFRPPTARDVFTLSLGLVDPSGAPGHHRATASERTGQLDVATALTATSATVEVGLSARVGFVLTPGIRRGRLRIRAHVSYQGSGFLYAPSRSQHPSQAAAQNIAVVGFHAVSSRANGTDVRPEGNTGRAIWIERWLGAGGVPLDAQGYVGVAQGVELLVPVDTGGATPRLYTVWVYLNDGSLCAPDPANGSVSTAVANLTAMVPVVRVEEQVRF